jgi:hypothetical protein
VIIFKVCGSSEYYSGDQIRRMRVAGRVARMGRGEVHTGFWLGQPEGKRPFGRRRRRWEDNIKMDL